ncbi:MAG: formyltransferase family protein [Acutalibacter sp.]
MLNIGVLVSGGGTNLQSSSTPRPPGDCKRPAAGGHCQPAGRLRPGAGEKAGIEAITLRRKDYPDVDTYSQALIDALKERQVDLVVLAGFLTITGDNFMEAFRNRIINVHLALLPPWGQGLLGLHVHEAVLARGVKVTGPRSTLSTRSATAGPSSCKRPWR